MPYIGNDLATQFQAFATQTITGDGSTGYTLDRAVANGKEILVYINNVKQEEGSGKAYTASGTTITFSEAVASGDSCYLVYMGSAQQTVTAPAGSIVSSQFSSADLVLPDTTTVGSTLKVDTIQGKTTAGTVAMPAGHVVQTSLHTFTTSTTLNSDSDADVGGSSHTFTPKFASSLLILSYSVAVQVVRNNTSNGGTINFVVDGSLIQGAPYDYEFYNSLGSGNLNNYLRVNKEVSMSASNTNAKTVKLMGRPYATGDSGYILINKDAFRSSIKIQEIAQ